MKIYWNVDASYFEMPRYGVEWDKYYLYKTKASALKKAYKLIKSGNYKRVQIWTEYVDHPALNKTYLDWREDERYDFQYPPEEIADALNDVYGEDDEDDEEDETEA